VDVRKEKFLGFFLGGGGAKSLKFQGNNTAIERGQE
jgi:hypothetical protein